MSEQEQKVTRLGVPFSSFKLVLTSEAAKQAELKTKLTNHSYRRRLLEVLTAYPDALAVVELSELLEISYSSTVYHLQKMCDAGLLYKVYWQHYLYYQVVDVPSVREVIEVPIMIKGVTHLRRVYKDSIKTSSTEEYVQKDFLTDLINEEKKKIEEENETLKKEQSAYMAHGNSRFQS